MDTIGTNMPAAANQKETGPLTVPAAPVATTPPTKNSAAKAKKSRSKQQQQPNKTAAQQAPAPVQQVVVALDVSTELQTRLQISSSTSDASSSVELTNGHEHGPGSSSSSSAPKAATAAAAAASSVTPVTAVGSPEAPSEAPASQRSSECGDVDAVAAATATATDAVLTPDAIAYVIYQDELQMPDIMRLIQKDLSEPYSIYTYRYFIHNWPKLCYLAMHGDKCVGAIVCKLDIHRQSIKRGYIAMLAVDRDYRKLKIGTKLVQNAIQVRAGWGDVFCHLFCLVALCY